MLKDVNMDEPLPAIQLHPEHPSYWLELVMLRREDGRDRRYEVTVTLSHVAQVLAALTGEQLGAVIRALPEETRLAALGEASRSILWAYCERADQEKARGDRATAVVEEAVAYQSEGPHCLFCSRGTETHVASWHAADCALVSAGYVTREGERKESKNG